MELFPYQEFGAQWLSQRKLALLADEPGLGKSAQVVTAADALGLERILIVCPAIATINWAREFKKFSAHPHKFHILKDGTTPPPAHSSIICSFELAVAHHAKGHFKNFDLAVADESHYLKTPKAKRTKAILGKSGISHRADRTWLLTGTPMPNHAGELWTTLFTFGVTQLKYDEFLARYCQYPPGMRPNDPMARPVGTKQDMIPELKRLVRTVMLRRLTRDVLKELPAVRFHDVAVIPGPVAMTSELQLKIARELGAVANLEHATVDEMRMLEAIAPSVSTLRRYIGLQKVAPCAALLVDELENKAYEKIVVFVVHKQVGQQLSHALAAFNPVLVNGDTPATERQRAIDSFQSSPTHRVFIANIHTAGTAITLTAAHHVFFVEQDWVPGNNAQAVKRCHRIGQDKSVLVRFAAVAGSFDEWVTEKLRIKTRDIIAVLG